MKSRYLLSPFCLAAVLATLAALPLAGADYSSTVLQDNPVGYWRLGEAEGATVTNLGSLGEAGHGTASDSVVFGEPGAVSTDPDTAAYFNGSNAKVEVPYSESLNSTAFTYEVWANVAPDSAGVHRSPLASRDDTPVGNTAGVIFYADPGDNWQFWNGRGTGNGWHNLGGATVFPGEWAHLVGTFDGTNKAFYVNGVLVGAARTAFVPNRARLLRIGASANENPVGQFFFNGAIDEAAVYDKVLSGDRILAHYRAGGGPEPELIAPAIVGDPISLEAFKGDALTLSVLATGSLPLAYEWTFNGVVVPGATNYSLILTDAQPSSSGSYQVTVRNSAGEVTSEEATLNVADIGAPVITQQPRARTVLAGGNVTFDVAASGSATFNYQWQFNGANLPNATNSTLTVTNVQPASTGRYAVIVSNAAGSTTSAEALLQIPAAATQSYAETVRQDSPVAYWRLDESTGEIASDSVGSHDGTYLNGVTLGLPGALVGDTNTAVGFSADSQQKVDVPHSPDLNTPEYTVELWARATGGTGHRSPLTSRADGPQRGYIFYADPANTWQFWTGTGESTGWNIIAGPPVQNNTWAHLVGVYDGTNKSFYVNGVLAGFNQAAFGPNDEYGLRIGGGSTEGDGEFFFEGNVDEVAYYNRALPEDRILAHYVAGLPQTTPPAITLQPVSRVVPPGATVTLTVSATGGLPMSYQWKLNNVDIPGATSSSLVLTNVQAATVGNYTVVVSNPGGTATSAVARVEFPPPPTQSYAEIIRADGPISYWRLDETSGDTARDSIGENHGAYLNEVTLGVPGAIVNDTNTAVAFQSASQQKVDVPFNPELNPEIFSVELWAKVTGAEGTYRSPLTSRGDFPPRGYIFYAEPGNLWQFWTGNGDVGGWNTLSGPAAVNGAWTHLVGTFDGTTKRFYVNGLEVASSTPVFGVNTENPLRFGAGRTEADGDYFFEGEVDEVAFYDKVLTSEQVVLHFAAGRPISTPQTFSAAFTNGSVILTWDNAAGIEAADDILGPWQDVPGAASPFSVTPTGARKFYRLK